MANQTVTIRVKVTDGNDINAVKKALAGLGAEVSRSGKDARASRKDFNDLYNTMDKGVIGTANSTKSFSKLAESIGGRSSGVVAAYAELAANVFAVTAAFNALRGAAQVEQVIRGLDAAGARTGQSLLTTASALREITGAAIDTEQALRATAQITSAGFGTEEVEKLGQAAKDASFALGRSMPDSLERLTRGVVKLEPELLDELGVMTKLTEASAKQAFALGKNATQLTNFEKRAGFLNAVLEEVELKFGGLSDAAGDSTAYDKLAASLSNLSTNTLSLVNTALQPLANLLSASPTALTGLAILFGSTLAGKLLPSLANSATASLRAAEGFKEHAQAMREAIVTTTQLEQKEQKANITRLKSLSYLQQGPKVYMNLRDAINAGTASAKDFDKALNSLRSSNRLNSVMAASNPAYAEGTAAGDTKRQQIDITNQEIARIEALRKAQYDADQASITGAYSVKQARTLAYAATAEASAMEARAAAIGAASQMQVRQAIAATVTATKEYALALALREKAARRALEAEGAAPGLAQRTKAGFLEAGAAIKAMWAGVSTSTLSTTNKLRVAMFGLGTAAKAVGSAMLAAIPAIGQIIFAFSMLQMAMDFFKSDAQKKFEKSFENLQQVIESTDKSIREYNRALQSTAALAARSEQAIIIQSNAIRGLTDAYAELITETNDARSSASGQGSATLLQALFGSPQEITSYWAEIGRGSQFIDLATAQLNKASNEGALGVFGNSAKTTRSAVKVLEDYSKLAPEATKKAIAFHGGLKALESLNPEQFQKAVLSIGETITDQYGEAAEKVRTLTESFKALEQALGNFAMSQIQSTPFDESVKGFQAVSNALRDLAKDSANLATADSNTYKSLLSGLGNNTEAFLTVDTKETLDVFKQVNTEVQLLEKAKANGLQIDESTLKAKIRERDQHSVILTTVEKELAAAESSFVLAQQQSRLLQSEGQILQANLAANQAAYAATAAGVKARMEGENKAKKLQVEQLELQKNILKTYIANTKAQLQATMDRIKAEYRLNEAISEGNILTEIRLKRTKEAQLATELAAKNVPAATLLNDRTASTVLATLSGETKQLALDFMSVHAEAEKLNKLQNDYDGIKRGEQAIQGYEAAIKALNNQQEALNISMNTAAQIAAEAGAKQVEIRNNQLNTLNEQLKVLNSITDLETSSAQLAAGRSQNLTDELQLLYKTNDEARLAIKLEREKVKASFGAEIARAQADSAKAASAADRTAHAERISLLGTENEIQLRGLTIQEAQINAQERNQILQKVAFDTQSTGLQIQQDALANLERQLSVREELVNATREQAVLLRTVERRRGGFADTEDARKGDEIAAAKDAYELAVQGASLRRATIKLEYALLEAQRQTSLANMEAQRQALIAAGLANSAMVQQLEATIQTLKESSGYIVEAQAAAMTLVDKNIENLRLKLQEIASPESRGTLWSQQVKDYERLQTLRKQAMSVTLPEATALKTVVTPLEKSNIELRSSVTELTSEITALREAVANDVKSRAKVDVSTSGGRWSLKDAAAYAIQQGGRVSEMEGYGGVSRGHVKNSRHYSGDAFDLNIGKKNTEWNIPWMKAKFDKLAEKFREMGLDVLWGEKKHFDHMHVSISAAAKAALGAMTKDVSVLAKKVEEQVETEIVVNPRNISVANDNAVEVKEAVEFSNYAAKLPEAPPSLLEFLEKYRMIMDQPNSISSVFGKMAEELGPAGEIVPAIIAGIDSIGGAMQHTIDVFANSGSSMTDNFTAVASAAQAALSTISTITAASSQAKIANIDAEIEAEQRRDGKSKESLAKIEAMEKRKDAIARKQFNLNKKLMMAQAIIATATSVVQALTLGPIAGPIMAGVIAALGAAQLAIISGTTYQSTAPNTAAVETPSMLTIGKQGDTVNLARNNPNAGGELGYLRGAQGTGTNASNYNVVGSAYGGALNRGYGNTAYVVGEKGPEVATPDVPLTVSPMQDASAGAPISASISINALDASGVEDVLLNQKGNIIAMLREAANSNGIPFLEGVDVQTYTRPNKANKL